MPRFSRALFAVALFFTAACSQPPAEVQLKGQNSYGHGMYNENYYSQMFYGNAPAAPNKGGVVSVTPQPIQQAAAVQPISSSELAPPEKSHVVASSAQPVNHWTNKPHFSDNAPVAQLDSVISNDKPAPLQASAHEQGAFIWPVNGQKILSGFGPKSGGKVNDGINIAADNGEPVWAAADGEVVYVGNELQGYGNMVLIKHAGNKTTSYAHLSSAAVDKYDRVKQGDIIGYVGATGNVKEPQLHFAIRDGKDPIDPSKYISRNVAGL